MATSAKRCQRVYPNWLDLPSEVVESVVEKLASVDIIRFKAVCSSWYWAANSYISSPLLLYSPSSRSPDQSPWLMLPTREDDSHSCLFNFAEKKVYKLKNALQGLDYDDPQCVGSSYGWLIIVDKISNACLFNPFTGARIELPSTKSLIDPGLANANFDRAYELANGCIFVTKAILLSDPTPSRAKSFSIVIMYGFQLERLAFYMHMHGDNNNNNNTWTSFGSKARMLYSDIIYHRNHLYALQHFKHLPLVDFNGSVEVWHFHDSLPKKVATFKHPEPLPLPDFPGAKFYYHIYLAESLDEILYVFRVSSAKNGTTVNDHAEYKDEFYTYTLDYCGQKWEKLETFRGGRALFLGGSQSMSLCAREFPEWKENSLYVTVRHRRDFWNSIPYFHDVRRVRVHNLEKKAHDIPFMVFNMDRDHMGDNPHSTAFWIVPNIF